MLAGLQLIVCPYSDIQQDESLLSHSLGMNSKRCTDHSAATTISVPHGTSNSVNCLLRSVSGWACRSQKKQDVPGVKPTIVTRTFLGRRLPGLCGLPRE